MHNSREGKSFEKGKHYYNACGVNALHEKSKFCTKKNFVRKKLNECLQSSKTMAVFGVLLGLYSTNLMR